MAVDVGLARGYARVNIRQVFENHTGTVQEGTWRFRLPASGAVGDFAVWDGDVRIPGVILEKRRARAIYRDLTTQRIDPGSAPGRLVRHFRRSRAQPQEPQQTADLARLSARKPSPIKGLTPNVPTAPEGRGL